MWDFRDDDERGTDARDRGATDSGAHCFVESRYVKADDPHAKRKTAHQVYYLERRDGHADEPGGDLFTAAGAVNRATARGLIGGSSGTSACFHRLILSPSTGLQLQTVDEMQAWTRVVLDELGQRLDRSLVYVAAIHGNTGRLHAHIIIGGGARVPSKASDKRQNVRLSRADLDALREITVRAAQPFIDRWAATVKAERAARRAERWDALDERLGISRKVGQRP